MGAPYKGREQEEVLRPSLQRRGVRRDVREYNRLGEGGGEVGVAHEGAEAALRDGAKTPHLLSANGMRPPHLNPLPRGGEET